MTIVFIIITAVIVNILFAIHNRITHKSNYDSNCDNCPLYDCKNRDRTNNK